MRLTKEIKKSLAMALSTALVITSLVATPLVKANAAEKVVSLADITVAAGKTEVAKSADVTTLSSVGFDKENADVYCYTTMNDIAAVATASVATDASVATISGVTATVSATAFADDAEGKVEVVYGTVKDGKLTSTVATLATLSVKTTAGAYAKAGSFKASDVVNETTDDSLGVQATAGLNYVSGDWSLQQWGDDAYGLTAAVKGSGTYTVQYSRQKLVEEQRAAFNAKNVRESGMNVAEAKGNMMTFVEIKDILTTLGDELGESTSVKLENVELYLDGAKKEIDATKVKDGDLEAKGNYRVELYNEYGPTGEASKTDTAFGNPKDLSFQKDITVKFTIKVQKATPKPSVKPSTKPSAKPTGSKTGKLTAASKSVVIAAGKSKTVKFTAKKATGAAKTAKVTASTSNKKVVTAKISGSKVKLTAPKKATKGATATVTLKSSGKTAKIKVAVQNKAKKVTASKKKVTVKAKKSTTLKFKVTATNKKKAAADTVKVTSSKKKVVSVVKTTVSKGKATVKVKGLKKGTSKVTLKIGSKSAKVTVKVK